jgi:hypothetical protein
MAPRVIVDIGLIMATVCGTDRQRMDGRFFANYRAWLARMSLFLFFAERAPVQLMLLQFGIKFETITNTNKNKNNISWGRSRVDTAEHTRLERGAAPMAE